MGLFLTGVIAAVIISYAAYHLHALSLSGGIAAAILGTIIFGLGGLGWALVLLSFFISSSGLSKLFSLQKESTGLSFSKGSRRDAWQVAANGGMAGVLALIYFIIAWRSPENSWGQHLWVGFASSLAAANADTWATELGLLNPGLPVLIGTLRKVPKGTSGAVSLVGTLASLAGSVLMGGVAVLSISAGWGPIMRLKPGIQFLIIAGSGMVGSLIDSVSGATVQSVYYCPVCKKETEQHPLHNCGSATSPKRGFSWLNNDLVNAACTISAGLIGMLLAILINKFF